MIHCKIWGTFFIFIRRALRGGFYHPSSFFCNGCRIYVDIMTGEKFRLLTWTSFIGQFVLPVGGGDGVKRMDVGDGGQGQL